MNKVENEMLDLLKQLRNEFGAVAVKAEFEAEGTRTDELLRLIDLTRQAELKVALKIGGCEAVRDLIESKQFGVDYIIAPMVETQYSLSKFIKAKNTVYSPDQQKYTSFLFNLETGTTYDNLEDMLKLASNDNQLDGVVFGRVDFTSSIGKSRSSINTDEITSFVCAASEKAKQYNLDFVVGGGVDINSISELKKINSIHLDRFETRKVVFEAQNSLSANTIKALQSTVYFELLWLKNKQKYYLDISNEDVSRISMLQDRWENIKLGYSV